MPAFHRRRMDAAVAVMGEEAERALDGLAATVKTSTSTTWVRELAMSIAMRALLGLDPRDRRASAHEAAVLFERGPRASTTPRAG